jgi:hypothetical protein
LSFLAISGFGFSNSVKAAISLLYFRAVPGSGKVTLQWATATELNNAGFFVLRSNSENGSFSRLNVVMIPAEGDSLVGASYEYIDTNVINGATYWYKLEEIDSNQQSSFHGPITAIPVGPQQTVSSTPTSTPTSLSTNTPPTPRPRTTSTPTPIPTNPNNISSPGAETTENPYPSVDTTPNLPYPLVENSGNEGSSELSSLSTATLIPLPEIAIEFPTPVPKTKRIGASSVSPVVDVSDTEEIPQNKLPVRYLWLIGVIVLIWGTLGIWLFFVFRKIS